MFKESLENLVNALANAPELPAMYEVELASEKETSRMNGYKEGVASASDNTTDKIYSQDDVDGFSRAYEEKILQKDEEMTQLAIRHNEKVEALNAEILRLTDIGGENTQEAVREAVKKVILEIEADLLAAQESENVTELEFKSKLEARRL